MCTLLSLLLCMVQLRKRLGRLRSLTLYFFCSWLCMTLVNSELATITRKSSMVVLITVVLEQNCGVVAVGQGAWLVSNVLNFLCFWVPLFCLLRLPHNGSSHIRHFSRFDSQQKQWTAFVLFVFEVQRECSTNVSSMFQFTLSGRFAFERKIKCDVIFLHSLSLWKVDFLIELLLAMSLFQSLDLKLLHKIYAVSQFLFCFQFAWFLSHHKIELDNETSCAGISFLG